jgi:hypothetical protein
MLFSTISSIIAAGALKLGYRLAEQKKWLPGIVYHKASLRELKNGDLRKAEFFNSIALNKKPEFNNALVVREVIAMQKDARIAQLKKLLAREEERIAGLLNSLVACQHILARQKFLEKGLKIVVPALLLLISGGLFAWIYFTRNPGQFAYVCMAIWVIILITALILDRTLLEKFRMNWSVARQELQALVVIYERELAQRQENRQVLLKEVELNSY